MILSGIGLVFGWEDFITILISSFVMGVFKYWWVLNIVKLCVFFGTLYAPKNITISVFL